MKRKGLFINKCYCASGRIYWIPLYLEATKKEKKSKEKSIYSYLTRVIASKKLINYSKTFNLMAHLNWKKKESKRKQSKIN